MKKYAYAFETSLIDTETGVFVSDTSEEYLAWMADGNTPDPYVPPPPVVPEKIEALNGLLVLDAAGLSGAYETWASAPERTFAQKAFINKAIHWHRADPTLSAAATDLGLTNTQVDNLFIQATQL